MSSSRPDPTHVGDVPAAEAGAKSRRWGHRLSTRIGMGFAIVLVLHLAVAVVGHWGINGGRRDLEAIDQERRWTEKMVEIDRLVRDAQQNVLLYAFTGHQSLEQSVTELHDELRSRLRDARAVAGDEPDLVAMEGVLARYEEHFELAKEDREQRKEIVDVLLVDKGRETGLALDHLEEELRSEGDSAREYADRAQREFLNAQAEALEYVHRLDYAAVRSAIDRMEICESLLASIEREDVQLGAVLDETHLLVGEFQELLIRMVQRTRGYLHLVNVVIAGETAEFLRLSERVRSRHVDMLEQAYANGIASHRRFEQVSLWVSVITVLTGIYAGARIARSVVDPVRGLAKTFTQLGAGKKEVVVPSRERPDEIGDMARAAEVFRDKNAETAQLLEDAERSNRDLEQFAYVASHDLQEPLRMVASYVQLIEELYCENLDDDAREFIGYAVDGTVRMKRLINDLLTYSRVGRGEERVEAVRTSEILPMVEANLAAVLEERGARVTFVGDDPVVQADTAQLVQVLQNLVNNGIKFCPGEAPEVCVSVREDEDEWVFCVEDRGIGIKPEHLERIFTVFQRLHNRDEYEGTGIGLAICRRLVERRGGRIWAESREEEGTSFFFTLPRDVPAPALPREAWVPTVSAVVA